MDDKLTSKRTDRKVLITEIAINKVPHIKYHGLTDAENKLLYDMSIAVLTIAREKNDSNEVSITVSLTDAGTDLSMIEYGVCLGTEHTVDILSDSQSFHLIMSASECAVAVLHNHPSTQTLSLEDISFLLRYASIRFMLVVTNQGIIHYLCKEADFSFEAARYLFNECVADITPNSPTKDVYYAGLKFLSRCSEVGLYYR